MYQLAHKQSGRWWLGIVALLVSALLLGLIGGFDIVGSVVIRLISPLQWGLRQMTSEVTDWRSRRELETENSQLRQQVAQLAFDSSQLRTLEVENQLLREELDFVEGATYQYVTGRVVAAVAPEIMTAVVVNRGSHDGVVDGAPVITAEGVLVGRVIEVQPTTATIQLVSDSRSTVAVSVQNNDQTIGVVRGEHGLSIALDMVPRDEEVPSGSTVITSGLQAGMPRGLLVGVVDRLESGSSELFRQGVLAPLVDYRKLSIVTIIIPTAQPNEVL